jgi:glyoxylase-like metal-dependent hydrolase (beta-lactamase superfamily II)
MQEYEFGDLGIFRIPIPIPFIEAGGPINVYAIEEERGLLLFDAGLGTTLSQSALAEGLARIGHRFEDINRIILSHGHIDHFGAAAWTLEQIGRAIPVYIHSADAYKVLDSGMDWAALLSQNDRFFSMLGTPLPVLRETIGILGRNAGSLGRRLSAVTPIRQGDMFFCRHVALEVQHMPGHTAGLCCLYEREHRLLFSADHLLEHVSPNPLIELRPDGQTTSYKPLVTYFESLNRVRALPIDLVLPGHGRPFSAPIDVIDSLSVFYQRRQTKVLDALKFRPMTAYEVMKELFPSNSLSGFEFLLTISEALGNLELLEHRGEIQRETDGESLRFRLRDA